MQPEWYTKHRADVEARFRTLHQVDEGTTTTHGPYMLQIHKMTSGPGTWDYSRGRIYRDGNLIGEVHRNYGGFPAAFVLDHPDGHDYILCGEDYQGITVIQLDTGERHDWIPPEAEKGTGFCHVQFHPAPNRTKLAVDGCIWACPYEVRVYDFKHPMNLPWPLLAEVRAEDAEVVGWTEEGLVAVSTEYVRKADGKPLDDLDSAELAAVDVDFKAFTTEIKKRWLVDQTGAKRLLSTEPSA